MSNQRGSGAAGPQGGGGSVLSAVSCPLVAVRPPSTVHHFLLHD